MMYREKEIERQQFNNGYGRKREDDQHTNIFSYKNVLMVNIRLRFEKRCFSIKRYFC